MPKFIKRPLVVDAVQWTGTQGSKKGIEKITNCNSSVMSARKQNLAISFEEGKDLKVVLNQWVVIEDGAIDIIEDEDFMSEHSLMN